jgi:hypothetical protein
MKVKGFKPMRTTLRLLVCLVTSVSIAVAAIPAQAALPQAVQAGCCAMMKLDAPANDCGHHAPKSTQDKQCCSGCMFCLAVLGSATKSFVYPPTGEESFAALSIHERIRSDRPPVPPPRA